MTVVDNLPLDIDQFKFGKKLSELVIVSLFKDLRDVLRRFSLLEEPTERFVLQLLRDIL